MKDKHPILIVEDNILLGKTVADMFSLKDYDTTFAENAAAAEKALSEKEFSVCLLDMKLPDGDGLELLKKWRGSHPNMLTIIVTAYGDIAKAVECIKAGAHEFLVKPVENVLLLKTVANAIEQRSLTRQVDVLTELNKRETNKEKLLGGGIIAESPSMRRVVKLARTVAQNDFSCLFIRGETGTGKGLFARTIHEMGARREKPFVEVNCSALPAMLVESELFGHRKGAFTDAKEDKTGLFELADTGTILLDEIGDMDVGLQTKLLKVIEEQQFRRIGDTKAIKVDVAVIAATNQNVEELVTEKEFRQDLYYRLNVIPLKLPPLRDHPEDIPVLCEHFLKIYSRKFGKNIEGFTEEAMNHMRSHSWLGNVRELRNAIERGCMLTEKELISPRHLLFQFQGSGAPTLTGTGTDLAASLPPMSLDKAEKLAIRRAMTEAEGNKNEAARILGVHRTTLYKKLNEYELTSD